MTDNETTIHAVNPEFEAVHPDAKYANVIYSGADSAREHRVAATNKPVAGANPGRVSFTAKLNPNEILDRCVMVEFELTATITGKNNGANEAGSFAKTNGLCLAAYPIQRCCNNLNVKLNTYGESVAPWEYIGAYNHTYDSLDLRRMTTFPSQPDNYNDITAMTHRGGARILNSSRAFNDTASALDTGPALATDQIAASDSPFSTTAGFDTPRCLFPPSKVVFTESTGAAPAKAVFTWTVTEPLIHPFFRNTDSKSVLSRISDLNVEMSFNSANAAYTIAKDLIKNHVDTAVSNALGADIDPTDIGFSENAYLVYRTYVPNVVIRPVLSVRYNRLAVYTEQVPRTFAAAADEGVGSKVAMNTSQKIFSHVPEKIFIFARPRGQFTATNKPEAFLRIDQLTFRTLNDSGCLSQATTAQLFQMSARNGLTMSYSKFARDIGSVVVIDLRKGDLGAHVPGTAGNFQFDLSLTLTNTQFTTPIAVNSGTMAVASNAVLPADANWDLYIIGTIPSKLTLDGTAAYSSTGEDVQEVLRALSNAPVHMMDDKAGALGGKSGWSKFVHGLGQVFGLARDALPVVGAVRSALGRGLGDDLGAGMNYGSGIQSGGAIRSGGSVLRTLK